MSDLYLEASVIGALLNAGLTPDASDVLNTLDPAAFTNPFYFKLYGEIKRQAIQRKMIDALLVADAMGDGPGVFADVMETAKVVPSSANLKGYAKSLGEKFMIRSFVALMEANYDSITLANNHDQALENIRAFTSQVLTIGRPDDEVVPVHIDELMGAYVDVLERRVTNGEESDTLKTGIYELDEITGGMNDEDFVVVAARPGMGKTEFALKVAEGVASSERVMGDHKVRRGVLIFTMEMSNQQVIERQIAGASNMPVSSLRKPSRMHDEDWGRVSMGIQRLTGLDVWLVDAANLTIEQIRSIAERHKRKFPGLSLILVDYLGLIKKPRAERNDLAIAVISGGLKNMAKELKTPVLSLSQLSRDVEKRPNKRPVNADLRDGGSIEQDADSIIMLYRDAVYNENSLAARFAEIIVTKNRFGELGTVYQEFRNGHFHDTNQDEARRICTEKASAGQRQREF
ncbi:replicative DNA helicase [Pantoea coffeiphila]|uniref:DNA 5'-3' helicase n=1 Tax=Pantoea coffeiphila TaxID=1465635 RepID=A0A2S9I5Q1_9GAMM|nr:replicative DNA helicase [Pantoea coffeiphila]PRD13110.1 replicative DNA helicase [Pantoea coffeiphila]